MAKKKKLTKKEMERFKKLLLARRDELLKQVGDQADDVDEIRGDTSADPLDMAGQSSSLELMATLGNHERHELEELDHALDKADKGIYGICEESGELINPMRLEAMPTARYTLEVQAQRERSPQSFGPPERPRRRVLMTEDLPISTDDDDS